MVDFAAERDAMVERQLRQRGITEEQILNAFRTVPREEFVDTELRGSAYGDYPLPIEARQTISQPYIVALMIQAAGIEAGDTVLEIGAGSGYAAAVMGRIASRVIGIERIPELVGLARDRMRRLGYDNVEIVQGDGTCGWPQGSPYDAIVAAASGSHVPKPLIEQLAPQGALVMPIGAPGRVQKLVKITVRPDGSVQQSDLGEVRFVPLIGDEGWREDHG